MSAVIIPVYIVHKWVYHTSASAESYLNECLAIYQSQYGPHHKKTLDIQDDLARLMVRTDRAEVRHARPVEAIN